MRLSTELRKEHLEDILAEIRKLEIEHPRARVVYDVDRNGIYIYYPMPKDFRKIKSFGGIR